MSFTNAITLLIAMSMAVERIVEILKGMIQSVIPFISQHQDDAKLEGYRRLIHHLSAAIIGALLAYAFQSQIQHLLFGIFTTQGYIGWTGCVILGLLSSGGSAFWNQSLGIVEAVKNFKQKLK